MNKKEIRLECCPFCGSPAALMNTRRENTDVVRWFVSCIMCGVETPRYFVRPERAAEVWNRRRKKDDQRTD